jgi:ComF family protein
MYEGTLMRAIHRLKYEGRTRIAKVMGPLLASFVARFPAVLGGDMVVIPVPLHLKKLQERGFNQALLLARHVSKHLKAELDPLTLRRVRDTRPQTGLKRKERRKNVRKAFDILEPDKIKKRDVILIDDVATTGSTMDECARVLKRAKAQRVYCITLARTAISKAC